MISKPDLPTHADQTMLKSFDGCRRKFYWWYIRRADYKITPPYFVWGRAWQEMLCYWYSHPDDSPEDRLRESIALGEHIWTEEGTMEAGYNNLETLRWAMIFYSVNFPVESFEVVTLEDKVELGFELPFPPRPTWNICGAIDGYLQWNPYGLIVLENKSAGVDVGQAKYLAQWYFDLQPMTYYWALREVLEEEPFGVYMNCVCKKILKKHIDEFQKAHTIPNQIFARDIIQKQPYDIEEFLARVNDILVEIEVEWDLWHWRRTLNTIECVGGIAKSPCPYQRLCLQKRGPTEISDEEIELAGGLVVRKDKWEPWKRGQK